MLFFITCATLVKIPMFQFYYKLVWIFNVLLLQFCLPILLSKCSKPLVHFGIQGYVVSHEQYGQIEYPPNAFCEYEIQAPVNYDISITILELDIEESNNCIFDYMTIGSKTSANPFIICGQFKPDYPITINSNVVLIRFVTDAGNQGQGFKIQFKAQPIENATSSLVGCGLAPRLNTDLKTRIIGGSIVNPGQWPWMISLEYKGQFTCAGTLIHSQWIMTAAHCFTSNQTLSDWKVIVGNVFLNWIDENEQEQTISEILIHPNYQNRHVYDFDVALIRLTRDVNQSRYVRPVCLPTFSTNQTYTKCYAVGWGRSETQIISNELRHVDLSILDQESCNRTETYKGMITDSMLCTNHPNGGKDACKGDSGGPLICQTNQSEKWYQIGIISFGKFCAQPGIPGIYHRVSASLEWILKIIDNR